jgi:probable rRNA maturation factor
MILFDPNLGPNLDPDNAVSRVKRPAASARAISPSVGRVPSVRSLSLFLRKAQAAVRLRGEVSVLLTSDEAIKKLNRQFRGKNKATDVLSFPAEPGPEKMAGDLAISVATARRQAAEQGHALAVEIKVLMLHGLLHLAGYDHETDDGEMARLERKLRARLGLPLGLIERVSVSQVRRKSAPNLGHPRFGKARQKATTGPSTPLRSAQDDKRFGNAQDDKRRSRQAAKKRTRKSRAGARSRTS